MRLSMAKKQPILSVSDLSLTFGGLKVLQNVNLSVPEGAIKAIVGPNGAGKTTLFNVLTGIYKPDRGEIFFMGRSIGGLRPHEIARRKIFRTFQTIRLFGHMEVVENVMVGMQIYRKVGLLKAILGLRALKREESRFRRDALDILKKLELEEYANEIAYNLPYGVQKKTEIARALAGRPGLLLLDEPAGGLNRTETESLLRFILNIRDMGVTIILIEHDMKMVMDLADEVLVLNYGAVIADAPPNEIQKDQKVIEAFLGRKKIREA